MTSTKEETNRNSKMSKPKTRNNLIIVGDFPPPITGAAKNNRIVAEQFGGEFNVIRFDTSGRFLSLNRNLVFHLIRVGKFFSTLLRLCLMFVTKRCILYHVPNAGFGLFYSVAFVFAAFVFSVPVVLHHRTFRYIDAKSRIMALMSSIGRRRVHHVFLSPGMEKAFREFYPFPDERASVVSNAALIDIPTGKARCLGSQLVIGHLSNLCKEKGLYDVMATFRLLIENGIDARLSLGGPAVSNEVADDISKFVDEFPCLVDVKGPIGIESKEAFYQDVDVFLFPTQYRVEAQPNVVFEALTSGCLVVAYARGSIPEMMPADAGLVVSVDKDFGEVTQSWIAEVIRIPDQLGKLSASSLCFIEQEQQKGKREFFNLIAKMKEL